MQRWRRERSTSRSNSSVVGRGRKFKEKAHDSQFKPELFQRALWETAKTVN
jgi:hypothetical protein